MTKKLKKHPRLKSLKPLITLLFSVVFIMGILLIYDLNNNNNFGEFFSKVSNKVHINNTDVEAFNSNVRVIIPKGSGVSSIAKILENNKIISKYTKYNFLIISYFNKIYSNKMFKAGEYDFNRNEAIYHIYKKIINGDVVQHQITIPEGFSVMQVVNLLKSKDNIQNIPLPYDLIYSKYPEGSLLPETYNYIYGNSNINILDFMKQKMTSVLDDAWEKRDKKIDPYIKNKEEALILSSIVEKESFFSSENTIISGVYINRLKKGMLLQADPTIIYGIIQDTKQEFTRKLLISDYKYKSKYNTYLNPGLPPSPICNPGKDALFSVLNPQWHTYFYFVANSSGQHSFSSTFDIHKINVKNKKKIRH